jgi:hypothetical protein
MILLRLVLLLIALMATGCGVYYSAELVSAKTNLFFLGFAGIAASVLFLLWSLKEIFTFSKDEEENQVSKS